MRFVSFEEAAERMRGKSVAVVGSAPSVRENPPGFVDSHEVVVRVNNYKTSDNAGRRTDIHYSFYGTSVRKTAEDLKRDGVVLCMCKCPNSQPIESLWHRERGRMVGVDFRYIYQARRAFWFCDTFVPDDDRFLWKFVVLNRHIPSTGFAAIADVLDCEPASVYLTGFDFFTSGKHNVDEPWRPGDPTDPIGHKPELEVAWIAKKAQERVISFDVTAAKILRCYAAERTIAAAYSGEVA